MADGPMNGRMITIDDLVRYLFGEPLDPRDVGMLGRLARRLDRVERLLWSILFALLAALMTLVANLMGLHLPGH